MLGLIQTADTDAGIDPIGLDLPEDRIYYVIVARTERQLSAEGGKDLIIFTEEEEAQSFLEYAKRVCHSYAGRFVEPITLEGAKREARARGYDMVRVLDTPWQANRVVARYLVGVKA